MLQRLFSSFWFRLALLAVLLFLVLFLPTRAAPALDPDAPSGGARIRGLVREELTGAALPSVRVTALTWKFNRWREAGSATTDAVGRYEIAGLEGVSYRLRFTDGTGAHAVRYYPNAKTVEAATTLGVPFMGVVDGVDMKLPRLGSLSGRVQSLRTGEALPGITVTLDVWPRITTITDRLGSFEFAALKEGEYKLIFTDPTRSYARCYYSGAPGFCNAVPVRVTDGKATTGVNQKLPETGGLLGTVVDALTGAPLSGIEVILYGKGDQGTVRVTTDAAGQVRIEQIEPETYPVELRDPSERYVSMWPGDVTIKPGETVTVTWRLQPIPPAKEGPRSVQGRIIDSETGAPLPNIRMALERFEDHWLHPHWEEVASTVTAADGTYRFDESPAAGRLSANDDSGLYERVELPFHDPEPGETVVSDGAMTKFMSKYGRFTGRVTRAGGEPMGYLWVYALRQDAQGDALAQTGEDGDYAFYAAPGVYKLWFYAWSPPYFSEYFDDARTLEAAQPLTLTVGQTITAHAILSEQGRIAGRVTDERGAPLKEARIAFYAAPSLSWVADAYTDAEGRYISPHLEDGQYRVHFSLKGRDDAVWGGGHDLANGADVSVRVDQVAEGVDAALGPGGAITGRVTDRLTGEPLAGIELQLSGWFGYTTTSNDGEFAFPGLPSAEITVTAIDRKGTYPQQSIRAKVTAPLTTTVEFPLDLSGHITGRVTDSRGAPLANVEVKFLQSCCWERGVWTDADGRYDSGPLPGHHNYGEEYDYAVSFRDSTGLRKGEYYENADTRAQARLVAVRPAQTVTVDAALDEWARVAGRVTDAVTGLPVEGVLTSIGYRSARTDADGRYLIEGILPAPGLALTFDDMGRRRYLTLTRPVTVTLNSTLEGQDAAMTPWGALSGRVTDERTGQPLRAIGVNLYYGGEGNTWFHASSTRTAQDGTYAFKGLYERAYRLEFYDLTGAYRSEAYPDAPTVTQGADVVFTPGRDTSGIDAALAPLGSAPTTPAREYLPMMVR